MTDDHSEINLCPHCGKENLPMVTRCVHCGSEMESLFTIFGQPPAQDGDSEDSLPDIIEEIRNDPALQAPTEHEPNHEDQPAERSDEPQLPGDQLPDWLARVRERAQEEEDATGDLVNGTNAMDAVRSEEGAAGVEGEFDAWISRIREKNQQENRARVRQLPHESEDPDQAPEWLKRIRALRPLPEGEITQEVRTPAPYLDGLPQEWTDEALDELRRQALGEDGEQETKPLPESDSSVADHEVPAEPEPEELRQNIQKEPQLSKGEFHNIPEDEEDYPELNPAADILQPPEQEAETLAGEAAQQDPEAVIDEKMETEPVQDTPQQESFSTEELVTQETVIQQNDDELPEESEIVQPVPEEIERLPEEPVEEAAELEQPTSSESVPPDLLLLRDQQDRADLLAALIEQEGRVTAGRHAPQKPSSRAGRLAVALLLLVGLVVSILVGPSGIPADTPKSMPSLALNDQIQLMAENDKVLVVLDYQAATSSELEALAAPILEKLQIQEVQLTFLTTRASGLFLAQTLLAQSGMPEDTRVEYLPGSYLNLLSQAINSEMAHAGNNSTQVKDIHAFKMVLLVSDSSDNIRGWLEQIAPWIGTLKFAAVTTQMEAPVLSAYFDSRQLVGYAAGVADGNIGTQTSFNYRAYRVGLLLMLVMLLLGMISKGEADAIRREEERSE